MLHSVNPQTLFFRLNIVMLWPLHFCINCKIKIKFQQNKKKKKKKKKKKRKRARYRKKEKGLLKELD